MGPGVNRNEILSRKSCKHNIASQQLVTLNAPCFEISKMWSAVCVTSELTEILKVLNIVMVGQISSIFYYLYDTKKEAFYQF